MEAPKGGNNLKKIAIVFLSIIITLLFLLPYTALRKIKIEKEIARNKYIATQKIYDISEKLVEVLNQSLEYVDVLEIIIKMNPDDPELIKSYADLILQKHDTIQNVAIAPDGIVKFIYPIEQNEKAIGHNLLEDPKRNIFVEKAIDEKRATIQGPVEAIQGGVLIFNRKAIFTTQDNIEKFWGLSVVSIDFEKVLDYCGLTTYDLDYYFALRAKKSDGYNDFVWGSTECFTKDSITKTIKIENQEWELAIYPKYGWQDNGDKLIDLEATDILYLILSFILFIFVFWHLNQYLENSIKAKIDTMTGALNKNTFRKKVIKNLKNKRKKIQAIIVMDVNDFKMVNDTYGHIAGDNVLVELSKRLMRVLRKNDLLARWGGDEFVVYLNDLNNPSDVDNIMQRMYEEVELPIEFNDTTIDPSIALGYALYPNDDLNFDELYKKADMMMYSAKKQKKEL